MFEQFDFLDLYVLKAGQRPCLRVRSRIPRAGGAQPALFTPEPRAKSQEPRAKSQEERGKRKEERGKRQEARGKRQEATVTTVLPRFSACMTAG